MMHTRRPLSLAIALAASTCLPTDRASAQHVGDASGLVDVRSGRFANVFKRESVHMPDTLAAPAGRAFAALPAAFAALPLPLTVVDTSAKGMGAVLVTVRQPLAGTRLSMIVDCGYGTYGPNAERYTLQLTMVALVRSVDSTRSVLDIRVEGSAAQNASSSSVSCSSSGRLENKFAQLVKNQLGF